MNSLRIFNLILCLGILSACAQSKFEAQSFGEVIPTEEHASPGSERTTSHRAIDIHDTFQEEEALEPIDVELAKKETVEDEKNEIKENILTEENDEESNNSKKAETSLEEKTLKPSVIKELPKVSEKVESTKKPSNEGTGTATITEKGFIKPTIYFFPIINEDSKSCAKGSRMISRSGETLINICQSTFEVCSEQGSCAITQNGKTRSFNIIGKFLGVERYFETTKDKCMFGYGVKSSCLDPFYTLAADLSLYKSGDVVYVPSIRGLALPDGSKHTGYFVIRDQGRGIIGKGRFDFFSGFYSWKNAANPFTKAGLGSTSTNVPYQVISGAYAKQFLKSRAFPSLPANVIDDKPF